MENPKPNGQLKQAAEELSAALFDLRDAFVELSLALRDLQFETDLAQRKAAEDTTRQLLARIAAVRASVRSLDSS